MDVREMMFGWDETFTYLTCPDCSTVWLPEIPDDLGRYYPQDYYSVDIDPEDALGRPGVRQFASAVARSVLFGSSRLASTARRAVRMRQFHSYVTVLESIAIAGLSDGKQTRVLDVGCGSGIMIYALALAGVERPMGVDPFAPADRTFSNGALLVRRGLDDLEGTFDLVMFHHSLEHVPDPAASLQSAVAKLAPGGRLLVRMPTVSGEAYETYGSAFYGLDAPRHITIPSRAGVDALAARVGLRVVTTRDDSTSSQFWASEQVLRGIPLMAPTSHMVSERKSLFTRAQIDAWNERARALNSTARGDQSAWVLERA
ncbi:class I SAM-dependent methyltransferase [Nocardioides piscis]|uniref:Class I SAM-dependent methyltransferase n=1 Tax=Nocardioides piscis TaxID=2714938 RepID=A0A6G7YK11_9ACTN|nr:class I SAM-dependent methyltransferase [Nocardioides piscis]QIK77079.1 class I SAM-dependent methyltransferase [Nocardioides piscis]